MRVTTAANVQADYGNEIWLTVGIEPGDGEQYRNMRQLPKKGDDVELVAGRLEELAAWLRAIARGDPEVLAKVRRA